MSFNACKECHTGISCLQQLCSWCCGHNDRRVHEGFTHREEFKGQVLEFPVEAFTGCNVCHATGPVSDPRPV